MTNYENDIIDLLQGDTPKQKYDYLKMLLNERTRTAEQIIDEICKYRSELVQSKKVSDTRFKAMNSALHGCILIAEHFKNDKNKAPSNPPSKAQS